MAIAAAVWATLGAVRGTVPAPESSTHGPAPAPSYALQSTEIALTGRLVFPVSADLKFETGGTVGEILVESGQRVENGQALARLDAAKLAGLEAAAARADVNVTRAREALNALKDGNPVEVAHAELEVARARVALDNAQESLDKLVNPEDTAVAAAEVAVARARLALKSADDEVSDLERDHAGRVSLAVQSLASARVALEQAWDGPRRLGRAPRRPPGKGDAGPCAGRTGGGPCA